MHLTVAPGAERDEVLLGIVTGEDLLLRSQRGYLFVRLVSVSQVMFGETAAPKCCREFEVSPLRGSLSLTWRPFFAALPQRYAGTSIKD